MSDPLTTAPTAAPPADRAGVTPDAPPRDLSTGTPAGAGAGDSADTSDKSDTSDTAADDRPGRPASAPQRARSATPARRSGRRPLLWLALPILLLAALGAAAWKGMDLYRSERAAFEAQQAALASRLDTLDAALQAAEQRARARSEEVDRAQKTAEALQTRVAALETTLGSLQTAQQTGRSLAELLAVEQLLLLAAERLQLAHDVDTANRALGLADARLASLRDPRLLGLRETITGLRQTLRASPAIDATAMMLTLSSLIERADALPLSTSLPRPPQTPSTPTDAPEAPWWQRVAQRLRATLAQIFIIRHDTGPQPQLLSIEQRTLIGHVLMLRLEGARAALLAQDTTAFRLQCEAALHWLDQHFDGSRPDVQATAATLRELMATPLDAPLPDLAPAAEQLRSLIEDQQAAATRDHSP